MRHPSKTPSAERYQNFKVALEERGVEATYKSGEGKMTEKIQKGSFIHNVTEENLLFFRSLTRQERRCLAQQIRRHA